MAAVSARRMRGPKLKPVATKGCGRAASSSRGANPPSGPTSRPAGPAAGRSGGGVAPLHRGEQRRGPPARRAAASAVSRRLAMRGTVRRSLCSAASMAIAASRSGLIRAALVASVDHRQQRGGAEFGGLLHDQVGGVALERGERQPEIGLRRLRTRQCSTHERRAVAAQCAMRAGHSPSRPLNSRTGIAGARAA